MDTKKKHLFVEELIDRVKGEILGKVTAMPDEWDGHELRRYIADKFEEAAIGLLARGHVRSNGSTNRMKAYRNEVLVRNL